MSDEVKGVSCECGHFDPFGVWVYAHWNEPITFTCPKCNGFYTIKRGKVTPKVTFAVWTRRTRADGEAGETKLDTYGDIRTAREFATEMVEYHGFYDARVINSKGVTVWEARKNGAKYNARLGGKKAKN